MIDASAENGGERRRETSAAGARAGRAASAARARLLERAITEGLGTVEPRRRRVRAGRAGIVARSPRRSAHEAGAARSRSASARPRRSAPERERDVPVRGCSRRRAGSSPRTDRSRRWASIFRWSADFETWQPDRLGFDAVVAFSAFHWLAPDLRYTRTADLLRERGKLGFVSTAHVLRSDGDPFFVEVQADYEAVIADDPKKEADADGAFYSPPWRLPHPDALGDHSDEVVTDEIEASGRFQNVGARRYLWDVIYTADDYIALLSTYSHHRALDGRARERLVERIHRRIEARPERKVRKTYLAMLYVAELV